MKIKKDYINLIKYNVKRVLILLLIIYFKNNINLNIKKRFINK